MEQCTFKNCCTFSEECSFDAKCTFGNGCTFGEGCFFGKQCSFENGHVAKNGYPVLAFMGFGSVNGTTYFFNCEDGIWVRCGAFIGTIEDFIKTVKVTQNRRIRKEYLMIADLVKMKWNK